MKCPLSFTYKKIGSLLFNNAPSDCRKEECAWWDVVLKECCILIIGRNMVGIGVHIHNIAEDMALKAQR